jgi:acetyltransferase-like isoleucine patch superfamily enzyme
MQPGMADRFPLDPSWLDRLDRARRDAGFLTIRDVLETVAGANCVLDPFSLLVGPGVRIGRGNLLHPGVTLATAGGGSIVLGDDNVLFGGTRLAATGGRIEVGAKNQLGEGGLVIDAHRPGEAVTIGDHGRYRYGAVIRGRAVLGGGSQVLGPVIVEDCTLGAGGSFAEPDPDRRGGVLKGSGPARGLDVPQGRVIASHGPFAQAAMAWQSYFHPEQAAAARAGR